MFQRLIIIQLSKKNNMIKYFVQKNIPIIKWKNEFGISLSNLDFMNDRKNDKIVGKGNLLNDIVDNI